MSDPTESALGGDSGEEASDPDPGHGELRDLVATCLERMELEGPGALDAVCAEHPTYAPRIRAAVGEVAAVGWVAAGGVAGPEPETHAHWMPRQLGDYRLLERLGEGGMGVVYLAEQEKLGRRVAVKLIRPDHLHVPESRDRLLREVKAVARLSHPGIVSVYDVGESQGLSFFSMEWIQGCTLGEVVAEFHGRDADGLRGADMLAAIERRASTAQASEARADAHLFAGSWVQSCLRIIRSVAVALEHAHQHGVIHRDIKPSNVMITAAGRVVLLDFGLAQMHGADKITRTGATVGSVAYMSPEQIQNESLDARTDVYSLGVTMYEALTLRAPFLGAHLGEVQWAILAGSPSAPRGLVPAIPADAETVCLTAMDRDRGRRYATAAAVAADLTAVLELQPILARRPGRLLKMRRWTQRHRAATLVMLMGLLIAVGFPLLWWWQNSVADERVAEVHALADETMTELERLTDQVRTRIGDKELRALAGGGEIRQKLIADVLARFATLRTRHPTDERLLRRGMAMHQEFAAVYRELGEAGPSLDCYRESLDLATELARVAHLDPTPPSPPALWATLPAADRHKVCVAWSGIVTGLEGLGRNEEVRSQAAAFSTWLDGVGGADLRPAQVLHFRFVLAVVCAQVAHRSGRKAERDRWSDSGIRQFETALETLDSAAVEAHVGLETRSELGHLYTERGNFAREDEKHQRARESFERALRIHDAVVAKHPKNEMFRVRRAGASRAYGSVLSLLREGELAEKVLYNTVEDFRELTRVAPDDVGYASDLGGALNNLAQVHLRSGRLASAADLLDEAIVHQRRAHRASPGNRNIRRFLTNHHVLRLLVASRQHRHRGFDAVAKEVSALGENGQGEVMAAFCAAIRYGTCLDSETEATPAEIAAYAAAARHHLEAAVAAKVRDTRVLGAPQFRALRSLPGFAALFTALGR